jgi:hypothetical protein
MQDREAQERCARDLQQEPTPQTTSGVEETLNAEIDYAKIIGS